MKTALIAGIMSLGLLSPMGLTSASAQTIEIGGDNMVYGVLNNSGYDQIKITKRSFTIIRAEACKGRKKYRVKVSILGKITSASEIGSCRRAQAGLDVNELRRIIRREGYRRVDVINDTPPFYTAEACREGQRYRLRLNSRARIEAARPVGRCRSQITKQGLKTALENSGYTRIEIGSLERAPYVVRACKDDDLMELAIGERGNIRRQQRIEACRREIAPNRVARILERAGYNRVNMLRSNRAPYLAEACKGADLMEVRINRYGDIVRDERVGRCNIEITEQDLLGKLKEAGYFAANVSRNGKRWQVEACREDNQYQLIYSAFGKQLNARRLGNCRSATALEILSNLEKRGARNTQLFVEGCFRNSRFRWSFDRLGNRTDRRKVGNC